MVHKITAEQAAEAMAACIRNAQALKIDAELLINSERYCWAFTLYHCMCEELAKFYVLEIVGRKLQHNIPINWHRFWKRFRSHDSKMAQAAMRAAAHSNYVTPDTRLRADAASMSWLLLGIQPRNRSLYVEIDDSGDVSAPDDVNWETRIHLLSGLAELLFAASVDIGHDKFSILEKLGAPSNANAEKMFLRAVALQHLFSDMTAQQAKEMFDKLWQRARNGAKD